MFDVLFDGNKWMDEWIVVNNYALYIYFSFDEGFITES